MISINGVLTWNLRDDLFASWQPLIPLGEMFGWVRQVGSDSSDKGFTCSENLSVPKLKKIVWPAQPSYFCIIRHISILRTCLLQKELELALIQAIRPNEVHGLHDRGHYSIYFQNLSTLYTASWRIMQWCVIRCVVQLMSCISSSISPTKPPLFPRKFCFNDWLLLWLVKALPCCQPMHGSYIQELLCDRKVWLYSSHKNWQLCCIYCCAFINR